MKDIDWRKVTDAKRMHRDFEMKRLRDSGLSFRAIGEHYGITGERVLHLVKRADRRLGLHPVPKTEKKKCELSKVLDLWEQARISAHILLVTKCLTI